MNEAQKDILEAVKHMPGLTRAEMTDLLSHINPYTLGVNLTKLEKIGKLATEPKPSPNKVGRRTIKAYVLPTPKTPPKPRPDPTRNELEELRAFKAMALQRYPDLAVDPIVLEARKIAAAQFDNGRRAEILSGDKDNSPIIKALVEALSR